ncbi:MAG: squalene/phytoene synthase family protein [Pseudomonadota bacterium]
MARQPTSPPALSEEYLPEPPSCIYYATLYVQPQRRELVRAIAALRREIERIPPTCSDPGIAKIKLAWWQEEAEKLKLRQPRHEISIAITGLTEATQNIAIALEMLCGALDQALSGLDFATPEAVIDFVTGANRGFLQALSAAAVVGAELDPQIADISCRAEIVYALCNLREHRKLNSVWLDTNSLRNAGLTRNEVIAIASSDRISALLTQRLKTDCQWLIERISELPRARRRQHHVLVSLARMYSRTGEVVAREGAPVIEQRTEITPIEKLWLAWRTHRFG